VTPTDYARERGSKRGITPDEGDLMTHVSMFGAEGYPIRKYGRKWSWGTDRVKGPPVLFRTKAEAVASFEAFMAVLRDAYAGRV